MDIGKEFNIQYINVTQQIYEPTISNNIKHDLDWLILIIIGAIVTVAMILCVLDFIHSKLPNGFYKCYGVNRSDTYHYINLFLFALAVCNLLSDIYLTSQIVMYFVQNDEEFTFSIANFSMYCTLSLSAAFFIIIPYCINITSMMKIYKMKCSNQGPNYWFAKHVAFFIFLELISCDSYLTVSLIRSHIFGLDLFDSGHSTIELKKIWPTKLLIICTQNIPQILIQLMFGIMVDNISNILMVSVSLSCILSIPFVVIWMIRCTINYRSKWKTYHIDVSLIAPANTLQNNDGRVIINTDLAHETSQFRRYKGHRTILKKKLCEIVGVSSSKIEIVYIDIKGGHKIHIVHKVDTMDTDITKLYDGKYEALANALKRIYHISLEWKIFCELSGFETETNHEFNILRQETPISMMQTDVDVERKANSFDAAEGHMQYRKIEINRVSSMYNNIGSIPISANQMDDVNLKKRLRMDTDVSDVFGVGESSL